MEGRTDISLVKYSEKMVIISLKRGIEMFLCFSKTQVFYKCNKRTSFLIVNKVLIENGFGILHPPLNTDLDHKYKLDLVNPNISR